MLTAGSGVRVPPEEPIRKAGPFRIGFLILLDEQFLEAAEGRFDFF